LLGAIIFLADFHISYNYVMNVSHLYSRNDDGRDTTCDFNIIDADI